MTPVTEFGEIGQYTIAHDAPLNDEEIPDENCADHRKQPGCQKRDRT